MPGRYEAAEEPAVPADGEAEALRAEVHNLKIALSTSRRIGMAMGILMATHRITDDEAFDRISTASQHSQTKLHNLAEAIILTGALDVAPSRRRVS
jgi:AmiR/NasT family two-component response regulator